MPLKDVASGTTRFKSDNFVSWLDLLRKCGFVRSIKRSGTEIKVLVLKTPLLFELSQNLIEKLMTKYSSKLEKGGLLFAEPVIANEHKILRVREAKFLRNISENPEREYTAGKKRIETMHKALMGTESGLRFFPIPFHCHSQPIDEDDIYYIMNKFVALGTSKADKKSASRALSYASIGISLLLPRALIYMVDGELFVGFYGGKIAPDDFKEYMRKLTGKTINELNSMMLEFAQEEKEWWKKALAAAGIFAMSLSLGLASSYPPTLYAATIEILRTRPRTEPQRYFALTGGEGVKILIP